MPRRWGRVISRGDGDDGSTRRRVARVVGSIRRQWVGWNDPTCSGVVARSDPILGPLCHCPLWRGIDFLDANVGRIPTGLLMLRRFIPVVSGRFVYRDFMRCCWPNWNGAALPSLHSGSDHTGRIRAACCSVVSLAFRGLTFNETAVAGRACQCTALYRWVIYGRWLPCCMAAGHWGHQSVWLFPVVHWIIPQPIVGLGCVEPGLCQLHAWHPSNAHWKTASIRHLRTYVMRRNTMSGVEVGTVALLLIAVRWHLVCSRLYIYPLEHVSPDRRNITEHSVLRSCFLCRTKHMQSRVQRPCGKGKIGRRRYNIDLQ